MLPQTEDNGQIGGQTPQLNDVGVGKRPRRPWLSLASLAIALVVAAALLVSGIRSRVRARATLRAETAQVALPAVSVVSPKRTAPAQEIVLP